MNSICLFIEVIPFKSKLIMLTVDSKILYPVLMA